MDKCDITCDLLGLHLHSPIILASGIWGTSVALMERAAKEGAGAVTAKSCGMEPRAGHPNPVTLDWTYGLINAIGLSNPGAEAEAVLLAETRQRLAGRGVPVIASIYGGTVGEFEQVARIVARAEPHIVEVNISCPNVAHEYGIPFAADAEAAAAVTAAVRRGVGAIPVSVKLSPNVPDIVRIGQAVIEAGADAITAINTMPGMLIDADAGMPVLSNRTGGLSGPAIKPIALRCVYELARHLPVPIIGTGGVMNGRDVAEMLTAGATAVGVGSVVYTRGSHAIGLIVEELRAWMAAAGFAALAEIRGRALS